MKIAEKAFVPLFLVIAMLVSCNSFTSAPAPTPSLTASAIVTKTLTAIPMATFTDSPSAPLSPSPPTATSIPAPEKIIYYYFVDIANDVPPEGSVVIMPDAYILAPTLPDLEQSPDSAANLRAALEAVINDDRNGWISSNLEIVDVSIGNGHANVVLEGDYFGVGDVTLIAASKQMLMTVFANTSVQTATVTLNGDTIGNLGVSSSLNAKPADYVFARTEIETFMDENAYVSP